MIILAFRLNNFVEDEGLALALLLKICLAGGSLRIFAICWKLDENPTENSGTDSTGSRLWLAMSDIANK